MTEKEQTTEKINVQPEEHKCACGCGKGTKPLKGGGYAKFIPGHWNKNGQTKPEGTIDDTKPQESENQPLVVTDLRDYHTDDVAWFQVDENKYTYLTVDYIGQINSGAYSVLVRTQQGVFIPPYLIPGFVGLASVNTQPELQVKEQEPELEPTIPTEDETFYHDVGAPVQEETKKPGLLAKLIGKKEPLIKEDPKKSGENLAEMLRTA